MAKNTAFMDYLEKAGIGQNEFARRNGINHTLLSRYVSGVVTIPIAVALKIEVATEKAVPMASWVRQ